MAKRKTTKAKPKPRKASAKKKPSLRKVTAEIVDHDLEQAEFKSSQSPDDIDLIDAADLEDTDLDIELSEPELANIAKKPQGKRKKSKTPSVTKQADIHAIAPADPVTQYMAELRKYPLLTKEEEKRLALQYYETKDPSVAQTLVKSNLRFVVKVAAEYSRFGARLIDLIQEGNIGLMHAVREFNPYKGVRLITYAVWWIRGYIQEYLMKQYSLVRIGTTHNQRKLFYNLQKEKDALDAMGQDADIKLISHRLGIPEDEVQMMSQRMSGRDVSLSPSPDNEKTVSLMDKQTNENDLPPDEALARQEELQLLNNQIAAIRPNLSEREIIILEERLLSDNPLTLAEIGDKYGITREAVRQMEARLMNKIKNSFLDELKSESEE